ncbi:unnamed protein product [Eruca vesicaria subsp. sativa]|uniref:Zinc finger GRF-type domain-containing protein n=1 Tax=Eruca vesicaria subsp. sativa TaxID=29727 RepID=A0ABC8L7A3_ERUVS|nr:unnamed protein product [Eruca vesicaria subsp. sativa]
MANTSSASSSSSRDLNRTAGPLCRCSKPMALTLSLTDKNPGRCFHRCVIHGLDCWEDTEEQTEWQKESLFEAKD